MSGRIRTIKPEILEDVRTAGLSDAAFRLFIAMILMADDHGGLRAEPELIRGQIWWRAKATADIESAMAELDKLVLFYEVDEQRYAQIRNWEKHQKVNHQGKRRVPLPPENLDRDPPETRKRVSGEPQENLLPEYKTNEYKTNDLRPLSPGADGDTPSPPAPVVVGNATNDNVGQVPIPGADDPKAPEPPPSSPKQTDADRVYEHWREAYKRYKPAGRPAARMTDEKTRKLVREAFRAGRTLEDLQLAVEGLFLSDFHTGANNGKEFLALKYALREGSIDAFITAAVSERERKSALPMLDEHGQVIRYFEGLPIRSPPKQSVPDESKSLDEILREQREGTHG